MFPDALFRLTDKERTVYLTFDDGPHPQATEHVLNVLAQKQVRATFFVLGRNMKAHPQQAERIQAEGHTLANHGMDHLHAWKVSTAHYVNDVRKGRALTDSSLFRPPYGMLRYGQYRQLKRTENIVFWDVLSGDFDPRIDGDQVVRNVTDNVRNGSIIVMHDSAKALPNLRSSLHRIIDQLGEKGYGFGTLAHAMQTKIV